MTPRDREKARLACERQEDHTKKGDHRARTGLLFGFDSELHPMLSPERQVSGAGRRLREEERDPRTGPTVSVSWDYQGKL